MKKTFWLLACFGIIYVCSCKKEPLPFQNSFSCKIDGVDWKPEGGTNATGGINSQDIIVYRSYYGDAITVNTLKNVRESKSGNSIVFEGFQLGIDLQLNKVKKLGKSAGDFIYNFNNGCSYYHPDSAATNLLIVTELDTIQRKVKGIFEFSAKSPYCGQTLKVTDGKFEIQY